MGLKRNGPQPSARGPAEYFTDTVRTDPLFQAPALVCMLAVSFTLAITLSEGRRTHAVWYLRSY